LNPSYWGLSLKTGVMNSAGNKFLEYRSGKALELPVFRALLKCPSPLLQYPHLPSAIGWPDAVHTRQERATQLQSVPNTSSSNFAI
jgi:hypothetical protein